MSAKRRAGFFRDNGLTLAFLGLFLASLIGQSAAGLHDYNHQLQLAGVDPVTYLAYITSSSFAVDVTENWQSEYLQFALFILGTVWLVQRGSPESSPLEDVGRGTDKEQKVGEYADSDSPQMAKVGGVVTYLYSRSLGITMSALFLGSWVVQSIAGWIAYNEAQLRDLAIPVGYLHYLRAADFWNRSLQNWQSEFLAVASMAVLAIYLRERGSSESKPVGAPHHETGT